MALHMSRQMLELCIRRRDRCKRARSSASVLSIWRHVSTISPQCLGACVLTLSSRWKNRHADGPLHARKPKKKKKQQEGKENRDGETYDSDVSGGSQRDSDLLVARGVRRLGVEG